MPITFQQAITSESIEELRAFLIELQGFVVKVVRDTKADDACWRDVYFELARLVGVSAEELAHPLPLAIQMNNCLRFTEALQEGSPYVATTCPKNDPACPGVYCFDKVELGKLLKQKTDEVLARRGAR